MAFLPPITTRAQSMRGVYDKKLPRAFAKLAPPSTPLAPQPHEYMLPWQIKMSGALRDGPKTLRMGTQGWQLGPATARHRPTPPPAQPDKRQRHAPHPSKRRKHTRPARLRDNAEQQQQKVAQKGAAATRRELYEATVAGELDDLDRLRVQIAQQSLVGASAGG